MEEPTHVFDSVLALFSGRGLEWLTGAGSRQKIVDG
jgi:hypothetical protein